MNRKTSLYSIFAAAITGGCALQAAAADFRTSANPVEGRYIVVLKPEAARMAGESGRKASVSDMATRISTAHGAGLMHSYDHVLRGFSVRADDAALARLLADPRVAYVEEDGKVSAVAAIDGPTTKVVQSPAAAGLDRIDQNLLPLSNSYTYNKSGAGVHAYIVDTGILATHNEYATRMSNGYTAFTSGGTNDCNGHGTHAAGVIGGTTYGVAKSVALHPVRVLDCFGAGTTASVLSGLNWVATNRVIPAVAYLGFSMPANATVDNAVNQMILNGVTAVATAGSSGGDACNFSPGRVSAAITVAGSNLNDTVSPFSSLGACVDIFAPAANITSSWIGSNVAISTISGTAMATSFVTGAAALYLQTNPGASPATTSSAIITTSTMGVLIGVSPPTPNRLLYTLNL